MTKRNLFLSVLAAAGLFASAGAISAAEDASKAEYMSACASCHGADAKGDGDIAKLLTVPVPDLTQLSANNDGAFPMLDVIHIIDGRTGVRGHGSDMPVWGSHFKSMALKHAGAFGAETITRGRILNLTYYLESIQE